MERDDVALRDVRQDTENVDEHSGDKKLDEYDEPLFVQ